MITSAIAFLALYMLTWPAFITLLILGILFEHNGARGWAVFSALVTMVVSYFFFGIPLTTVLLGAAAYVAIGVVWSFFRYKRHVNEVVERNKESSRSAKDRALEALHPKAMLSTITAWILVWPFSLVENFVGDIINGIQLLVQKVFRSIYHKIYDSAVSKLSE
jgi:hypothetical protein